MSSSLENEDLDNVPLVRMEDVQPSRERVTASRSPSRDDDGVYETCIIDDIEYENECIVNDDDDSNLGSMVSLQSEDVYEEDSSSQELIIPEVLEEIETEDDTLEENLAEEYMDDELETHSVGKLESLNAGHYLDMPKHEDVEEQIDAEIKASRDLKSNLRHIKSPLQGSIEVEVPPNKIKKVEEIVINPPSESWPTLEILPGGVIKNTDKYETDTYLYPDKVRETVTNTAEMMYACAKCSQTFKYLFCLVKHVKWHEDQSKIMKDPHKIGKMTPTEMELIRIKRERNVMERAYKKQKLAVISRLAAAIGKLKSPSNEYICLHSGKKKILAAERNKRKTPKRLKS